MKNLKFITVLLLLCGSLVLTACQKAQPTASDATQIPPGSHIQNAHTGSTLTPEALLSALSDAPIVIVGEEHTNVAHHAIELWLLQNLQSKRKQGSVLMEMIAADQQPAVNDVKQALQGGATMRDPRIQEALRWNPGWPWALYGDLVKAALRGDYPLLAANIPRAQVSTLYKKPTFPAGEHSAQPAVRDALSAIIYLMHGGEIAPEQLTAMLSIQQNRDRFMAQQLIDAPKPALLFAGGYHAAKDVGVPLHIQDLNGPKPLVVILAADGATPSVKQADYIWSLTAAKK
ncbi:MAG: ChaN family lipoprotein [Enterobacter sp.]|jgi:uncharacterized iron-regulated protein|nr:ChaN family lipoprotein [Enterobacter sp.]